MNIYPDYAQFKKELKTANIVPVFCDFPGDLETPVSVFLKVSDQEKTAFLLESVELGEKIGRYSLIGLHPAHTIEYRMGSKPLLDILNEKMHRFKYHQHPKLPSFVAGFFGFVGYELVGQFEDIKISAKKGISTDDALFYMPRDLILFDHVKRELKLVHLAIREKEKPEHLYKQAVSALQRLSQKISSKQMPKTQKVKSQTTSFKSNITAKEFETRVRRAKEYIRAGDIIQVVLSQRFDLGKVDNEFEIYRALRSLNPSPYMFYFKHNDLTLVGSSPEMLSRKMGEKCELRPIAGTRPRGKNEKEDLNYEKALKNSKKEMAEHLMLVDLGRNDLGRVAMERSVKVEEFARVERYSHVMHLVSDITAVLKPRKTAFDLLRSTFPAGTVTGAPKIRAMQIIDELERDKRGPYSGCLGYFSLAGDMDMCITIRTIVIRKKQAFIQAGAGIVLDSNPKKEYQETVNKARALFQAVQRSKQ